MINTVKESSHMAISLVFILCSYTGRAPEAAPAAGSKSQHVKQHKKLLDDAFRKL